MTGSRIFSYHSPVVCHSVRFFFFVTEPTSFVPRYCGGTRLFFLPLSQSEEGDASVAYIHVYHPWSFVAGTVGGYPCSARQSYGSSARVVEYRRDEVSGAEHVLVRTVPESLSGELVLHVAHQRFSRRPGLLQQALPCSRSSPCAAPRPFPSLSGRCLSERDCRRAERLLWA